MYKKIATKFFGCYFFCVFLRNLKKIKILNNVRQQSYIELRW